jgi:hypothetical protein
LSFRGTRNLLGLFFAPVGIPVEKKQTAVVASPDQQRQQGTKFEKENQFQAVFCLGVFI